MPLCELGGADRYCGRRYRHHLCTGHQHQPGTDGGDYENYAAKLGYDLPQTLKAVTFADNTQISSWAKDAVKSMQQAGILAGKNENKFDPKGNRHPRRGRHGSAAVCGNRH